MKINLWLTAAHRLALRIAATVLAVPLFLGATASSGAGLQLLHGHVPAAAARLSPIDHLPGTNVLHLAIGLPSRDQPGLDSFLQRLNDPASPDYHQYLTPQQFADRFGPTKADYQALINFAASNHLTITARHTSRLMLSVQASTKDVEAAFHVSLLRYRHPTESRNFYAPDREPSIDLSIPVVHISGLDNYSVPHPKSRIQWHDLLSGPESRFGSGPYGDFMGHDFRAAYVPGTTLTGAGQSVGLLQFDGFYPTDITSYNSQAGLTNIPLIIVPIDGGVSIPGTNDSEVCLDIDMAASMAPGLAAIYVYEAPNPSPWLDLLSRMADDNLSRQLSCSWGGGGPDPDCEVIFQQMAAQGQTFFNAIGDDHAFVGPVPFPGDSPNITQVGGTTLTTTGPGGSYVSETVWNNSKWGSGGGISTYYFLPGYQTNINMAANLGSATWRNVPDVALTADNIDLICDQGLQGTVGGTSAAAPLWAGFIALVNQQAAQVGHPVVGFLNPAIYALGRSANYNSCFHDTVTGNNFWSNSPSRFPAVPGYDLCTGWGTPAGMNLITALTAIPILQTNWVDFHYVGVSSGYHDYPLKTLGAAVTNAPAGGNIAIKTAGSSPETLLITKPLKIRAYGGTAHIGP